MWSEGQHRMLKMLIVIDRGRHHHYQFNPFPAIDNMKRRKGRHLNKKNKKQQNNP